MSGVDERDYRQLKIYWWSFPEVVSSISEVVESGRPSDKAAANKCLQSSVFGMLQMSII